LQFIYEKLSVIIARYRAKEAVTEYLFFGKNVTTAIEVLPE
jgi:Holliday junction resolvasome RuvABC endonuclease subunit